MKPYSKKNYSEVLSSKIQNYYVNNFCIWKNNFEKVKMKYIK